MRQLIFLLLTSCFAMAYGQDTIYIGVSLDKMKSLNDKDFYRTFADKKDTWFVKFGHLSNYHFYHQNTDEKKEISKEAFLKLNIIKSRMLTPLFDDYDYDTLYNSLIDKLIDDVYPGFSERAGNFYDKQARKFYDSFGKLKPVDKHREKDTIFEDEHDKLFNPPPVFISYCKWYLVDTTPEGRYFLYEVRCKYFNRLLDGGIECYDFPKL